MASALSAPPCAVKMCGITTPDDAAAAAAAGAQFVGMIIWPNSKRSVSLAMAVDIAEAARQNGAKPVGVFVDEDASSILHACTVAGIQMAQLHGDGARSAFCHLQSALEVIYVLHANRQGCIQTPLPPSPADWILVDGMQGGSGQAIDWCNMQGLDTVSSSKHGWMLAGGLHPGNVSEALAVVKPEVVDVSSGITGPDGVLKDRQRISAFMQAVRSSSSCVTS